MRHCSLLCAFASVLVWRAQALAAAQPPRPNIILILADDLGWGDVGFNGRREWRTPNLDRLAAQGTVFRRWYTGAVVCAPSRAVLMTGKYTIHNGVSGNSADLPRGETTIAEALRPLGYRTALFGKWHHGRARPAERSYVHPLDHGFDEFAGYTNARDAWEHFPKELWFGRERKAVQGYSPTILTGQTIDFIRRHRERRFICYVPFTIPHWELLVLEDSLAEYRGKLPESGPYIDPRCHYANQEHPRAAYAVIRDGSVEHRRVDGIEPASSIDLRPSPTHQAGLGQQAELPARRGPAQLPLSPQEEAPGQDYRPHGLHGRPQDR